MLHIFTKAAVKQFFISLYQNQAIKNFYNDNEFFCDFEFLITLKLVCEHGGFSQSQSHYAIQNIHVDMY